MIDVSKLGKVGVALAGCGALGILQSSAIKAIRDLGIEPDCIFSSSAGTLNGLLYASGEVDRLQEIWMNIRTKDVYKKTALSSLELLSEKGSLYDSNPLLKTLKKLVNLKKLREFKGKFFINATSLTTFKPITLEARELTDEEILVYSFASASPPIFFPPVPFRGQSLTDSGISNNYALINAINEGCDTIIVLAPGMADPRKIHNAVDMLKSIITISMQTDLERESKAIFRINDIISKANDCFPADKDLKHVTLIKVTPDKALGMDFLDFDYEGKDRKEIMRYGYNLAMSKIEEALAFKEMEELLDEQL